MATMAWRDLRAAWAWPLNVGGQQGSLQVGQEGGYGDVCFYNMLIIMILEESHVSWQTVNTAKCGGLPLLF